MTVWNRTPDRAKSLVDLGATLAKSFPDAVEASPAVLVCVDNYNSTRDLFSSARAIDALRGRTVIQLSTSTSKEAREANERFTQRGADYLDGGILGGPAAIGSGRVQVVYSGSSDAFVHFRSMLVALGERSRFVGADPGAASAIDFAWLANRFGTYLSAAYETVLCEAEGVDVGAYADVFGVDEPPRWVVDTIKNDAFESPTATLSVLNASLRMIQQQAKGRGVDTSFPDYVADILDRAERAGFGGEHIAAMVKVFRGGNGRSKT